MQTIDPQAFMIQLNQALDDALIGPNGWRLVDEKACIERRYSFGNFRSCFAFMTQMALYSEHHDHHPCWQQDGSHLVIELHSHDVAGLSKRDLNWAIEAERLYGKSNPSGDDQSKNAL